MVSFLFGFDTNIRNLCCKYGLPYDKKMAAFWFGPDLISEGSR